MTDEQKQKYKEAKNKRDINKYHNMTNEQKKNERLSKRT